MRIDKFLAHLNICERKDVASFLKLHEVIQDARRITKKNDHVNLLLPVSVDTLLYVYEEHVYFLLNKPKGYISSTKDEHYPSVCKLLHDDDYRSSMFPVGRLDVDTTGLLLLTSDGTFAHELTSPRKQKSKTYRVTLEKPFNPATLHEFEKGIQLHDFRTKPAILTPTENASIVHLTLTEGKFHQVKRMFQATNNMVVELHRISFGPYTLPEDLKPGEYIKINPMV